MKVTYLHHSGFAVETERTVLLFDYYTEGGRKAYFDPAAYGEKEILVFVSHAHEDHADGAIWAWAQNPHVRYILSADVVPPKGVEALTVVPHENYTCGGAAIETLRSNDEGVAFLVRVDGKTIYHAGDLNWWHWNGEPDAFNEDIRQSYTTEIDRLRGVAIDVAFVPADPRLADKADWAVQYFMETVGAKVLFPMHFWGRFDICDALQKAPYGAAVRKITKENEAFLL